MGDNILKLGAFNSATLYTVFVTKSESDPDELIDRDLSCSAAQDLCHSEQKSWGEGYSAWMQKQKDDQIEVECDSCSQKQLMPINQVLTKCENCGDWFGD